MSAHRWSLAHLSDHALKHALATVVRDEHACTARVLAHIAEFDARRLCREAGYQSTFRYCVGHLRLSEDAAYWRIRAARVARRFPAVFAMVADGRLHLTGVVTLRQYLTAQNADELLAAATHKSRRQIELLLAIRFPKPDVPTVLRALPASPVAAIVQTIVGASPATDSGSEPAVSPDAELVPAPVFDGLAGAIPPAEGTHPLTILLPAPTPPPRVRPLAPERFALQVTIPQATHDKLRRAQELLGFRVEPGDLAAVLDLALDALIEQQEKRKYAATAHPHPVARESTNPRHVPARVKRAVRERDEDRCTFVADTGRRCEARHALEFDHVIPVARGGTATVDNLRLRCRAHNQLAAEQEFGTAFMERKRAAAQEQAACPPG